MSLARYFVTAALIRQARAKGLTVAATKPLISGFDKSESATGDTGVLLAALGEAPTDRN
jgi:dethiobiotin synthetase